MQSIQHQGMSPNKEELVEASISSQYKSLMFDLPTIILRTP